MNQLDHNKIRLGLMAAQILAHRTATNAGWYIDPKTGGQVKRNFGEVIALMHSELSEAVEGGPTKQDPHLPKRLNVAVELADCMIRIGDTAGALGIDTATAFMNACGIICAPWDVNTIGHLDGLPQDQLEIMVQDGVTFASEWMDGFWDMQPAILEAHCALSRALEADRKGRTDDIPLAFGQAIRAILSMGYDVAGAFIDKNQYNQCRSDHKLKNRAAAGGKAY